MATQDERIKWIKNTPFMVDGFQFCNARCKHYLLTHFHSDHTTGLDETFDFGAIYTSEITAALVKEIIRVDPSRVVGIPMETPTMIEGFEITLCSANHCPGAIIFIIRDPATNYTVLHTGDFRAAPHVCSHPLVTKYSTVVDALYLDTTYCNPRYTFMDQPSALEVVARLVREEMDREPNTLFLVGTYSIGKEKVAQAISRVCGSRCLVTEKRALILRLCGMWDEGVYTTRPEEAPRLRAVPLQQTMPDRMAGLIKRMAPQGDNAGAVSSICAFRPTGWAYSKAAARTGKYKPWIEGNVRLYSVPYSEHSSFDELRAFVKALRPKSIIPTVNAVNGVAVERMVQSFLEYMDLTGDKKRLDSYFSRKPKADPCATCGSGASCITPPTAPLGQDHDRMCKESSTNPAGDTCCDVAGASGEGAVDDDGAALSEEDAEDCCVVIESTAVVSAPAAETFDLEAVDVEQQLKILASIQRSSSQSSQAPPVHSASADISACCLQESGNTKFVSELKTPSSASRGVKRKQAAVSRRQTAIVSPPSLSKQPRTLKDFFV